MEAISALSSSSSTVRTTAAAHVAVVTPFQSKNFSRCYGLNSLPLIPCRNRYPPLRLAAARNQVLRASSDGCGSSSSRVGGIVGELPCSTREKKRSSFAIVRAAGVTAEDGVQEYERARAERKEQGLLEYESIQESFTGKCCSISEPQKVSELLKRELSLTTVNVAVGVTGYCFLILSTEAAVSYGIGALASLGYLQLLYRYVDGVSEDNVPHIFVQRRRVRRIGITSDDLQKSIEKTLKGSSRALSSPRLVIPAALFGLWELTSHFADESPIHLQVAPLMFGFFAYKGAALWQAYRDNKDLLFNFPEPKGPEDS